MLNLPDLLDRFDAKRIAQRSTPRLIVEARSVIDATLLRLAVAGSDISSYTAQEQQDAADVLDRLNHKLTAVNDSIWECMRAGGAVVRPLVAPGSVFYHGGYIWLYELHDDQGEEGDDNMLLRRYNDAKSWLKDVKAGLRIDGVQYGDATPGQLSTFANVALKRA